MSDDLTDDEIALLCDIEECNHPNLTGEKGQRLQRLLSGGYIELTTGRSNSRFTLTAKGAQFLGERGVGLNEA